MERAREKAKSGACEAFFPPYYNIIFFTFVGVGIIVLVSYPFLCAEISEVKGENSLRCGR